MKSYQLKSALRVLRQSRAVLHPVAAVHVKNASDLSDFRPVNVAADHPVNPELTAILYHGLLVIRDIFHGRFGLQFDVGREGPVAESQSPPHAVDPDVEIENAVVQRRSHPVQEPVEVRQSVELMAMNHQVASAIGRDMNGPFDQPNISEAHAGELLEEFIVVAVDERDPGLFAVLAKQFLNEDIVVVRPIPLAAQLPAVDEIAHDVKLFTLRFAQEIKELGYLGMPRAQVNVRNPNGAIIHVPAARTWPRG